MSVRLHSRRETNVLLEVVSQLESLAFGPGTAEPLPASAGDALSPPSPRDGGREDQALPPPAEGACYSPPPAIPSRPPAAVPSSDSDSDTDSGSSSTTSSSFSLSSVSDEDDNSNLKDNRSYCIKIKDELPIDDLPPVEDLTIILPDDIELKLFGTVSSIPEQLVIIESLLFLFV
ncbi:H/ACA ribonucleoprotein complex non-core subunit NAF1-like [Pezoporus flaviventris]|uniref:H/ACA ribonucleoprotein complex non-core subunit NAF1-like n=1 Tax=Pezoporus flaviventris TaxID=889875 RepID=UPI002AAF2305|nr:H/ACA ribonucleoprotein complex non-core subunit NAF1-like [Pezoporus flaviventris]